MSIRECFLGEECWSTDNEEEEKVMKDKIRTCVLQSTRESKENGGQCILGVIRISSPFLADPDNIFNFSGDDQVITKARQLVHQRVHTPMALSLN